MPWTLPPEAAKYREGRGRELALQLARQETRNPKLELTDYELDMRCFNLRPWRCPFKHHFLLRAMKHQWGDKLMLETTVNGQKYVNYWAVRIASAICCEPLVNMLGCASSGKTHMATCCLYTIWKSLPYFTSVYLSTTSGEGADARAWATVQRIYREDKFAFGKLINSMRTLVVEEVSDEEAKSRDLRNSLKCVLIKKGNEGRDVVAAISGRKNKRVIWNCDEQQHLDTGILSGRVNLFSNRAGGGWAQFIGSGNGPKDGDPLFIDAEPENGWTSINKDEHWTWKTRSGVCLYFNGSKSPNMQVKRGEKSLFPGVMDWDSHDAILQASFGDTQSPEFYIQFYGFPPSIQIADTVLTPPFMSLHGAFLEPEWSGEKIETVGGLDLGFRKDGDPCVIHFGKVGKDARNKRILAFEPDGIVLNPSQASKESFEDQIAAKVVDECHKRNCHNLALDVTGDGGIILQTIERTARRMNYTLTCVPVSFSGTGDESVVIPGEKRTGKEMFANKVSQLWMSLRVCVGNGVIRGLQERGKAVTQLCQRKFHTDEKKRFSVEPKREMKLRLKRSPDQGDAAALCCHMALKMGLSGAETAKPKIPDNPFVQKQQTRSYQSHGQQRSAYTGHRR